MCSLVAVSNLPSTATPPALPITATCSPLPAEYGTGPAAYVNRYRNAWPAALANIALAVEDAKRRRGRGELKVPTGTCGGLVVTELPAPMAALKFSWEQPQVDGAGGWRRASGDGVVVAAALCAALGLLQCSPGASLRSEQQAERSPVPGLSLAPVTDTPFLTAAGQACLSPVTRSEEAAAAAVAENAK